MALPGHKVKIGVTGDPVSFPTELELERITDTEWKIPDETKQVVDRETDPILEKDDGEGNWEEISYKKVKRLEGVFLFDGDGYDDTETIRIKSGKYYPMSTAAYAHQYDLNRGAELLQVPKFDSEFMERIKDVKFASGTISKWDVADNTFKDALIDDKIKVVEIKPSPESNPIRLWAIIEQDEMTAEINSPQDEVVSFVSTEELLNLS